MIKIKNLTTCFFAIFATTCAFGDTPCNNIQVWNKNAIYSQKGTQVQYEKNLYKSLYWNQGNIPINGGPWQFVDSCIYLPTKHDHVNVAIDNFPKSGIAFTNAKSNETYVLTRPGGTVELPYSTPTTYYITTKGGTLNPGKFIANSISDTVNLSYKSYIGQHLLAGYLTASWGPKIKISEAAKMGYNMVIVAFGEISGTDIGLIQNQFIAYTNWGTMTPEIQEKIRKDILTAKTKDNLHGVLLSVGGANGDVIIPRNTQSQVTLAKNMIKLFNTYGFDGIDFDMENATDDYGKSLHQFIGILKSMKLRNDRTPIVTAAPQLNSIVPGDPTKVSIVSTSTSQAYNQAIAGGDFDYLFIQAYNTGAKSNIINGSNQTDSQYISNAYNYLNLGYPGQLTSSEPVKKIIIPSDTKIIIGEPATPSSAGNNSIFYGSSANAPYQAMYYQYSIISSDAQYGGVMTWDINSDATNSCMLSHKLAPLTSKSFVLCPKV